jgi:hypothetical protein
MPLCQNKITLRHARAVHSIMGIDGYGIMGAKIWKIRTVLLANGIR